MNDETEIQKVYTIEEMFKSVQKPKKPQSNGRSAGLWLMSWGLILFAFIVFVRWEPPENLFLWICYSVALVLVLLGSLVLASSFDGQKESKS